MADNYSTRRAFCSTFAFLLAVLCSAQSTLGQYTFVQDTDNAGSWSDPAQWTGGPAGTYPNAIGATALINAPTKTGATGNYNLTLPDATTTIGELKVDNTNFNDSYRSNFASGGSNSRLAFQATSGAAKYTETIGTAPGATNSQYQFLLPVDLLSDLVFSQDNYPNLNTGTTFSNIVTGASNLTLTKTGHGGLQFNYNALPSETPFQGHVVINQGGIRLLNPSPFSKVADITVNSGGQLMLADNGNNTANFDWTLGTGVLTLNGAGKATDSPQTVTNPDGALRFALGQAAVPTTTLHNPVVLQTDSVISVVSNGTNPLTGVIDSMVSGPGGLTKHGAGTLILSNAADSYGGDTKLLAGGPLSITNPILSDARDVYLVTGSVFNLNFGGTDMIRSLFIDGVGQATGTWGSVGSGATHESALITGGGLLNVSSLPGLPGDYNGDNKVDAADYVLWRQNPVAHGGDPAGYTTWRANFGAGSGNGLQAGSVPEPSPIVLLLGAVLTFATPRRRVRSV